MVLEPPLQEEECWRPEMIDNPLYDFTKSKDKSSMKREQDGKAPRKELPTIPDQSFPLPKPQEADSNKSSNRQQSFPPFVIPTPRFRSYTCSNQSEEKIQGKQKPWANLDPLVPTFKKPDKFSRSEPGHNKPPLPSKSQVVLDMQNVKGRDYRESLELPHHRKHQAEEEPLSRTTVS